MTEDRSVTLGSARFSLLTPHLARLQHAPFDERPSMRVLTRPGALPFAEVSREADAITLRSEHITITYHPTGPFDKGNLRVMWQSGGMHGEWHPGLADPHNLGGTVFSLDYVDGDLLPKGVHPADIDEDALEAASLYNGWAFHRLVQEDLHKALGGKYPRDVIHMARFAFEHWADLSDRTRAAIAMRRRYPPGVLSRSGYFVLNDSRSARLDPETGWQAGPPPDGAQDWYFFAYGRDYAQALHDFVTLCGRAPMLPRWALGHWHSYWRDIGEAEQETLASLYEEHDLPLDVLVLDMQWHKPTHWSGFDWHPELFPNPQQLLSVLHAKDLHVPLNLHFDGIPLDTERVSAVAADLGVDIQARIAAQGQQTANVPSNETERSQEALLAYDLGEQTHAEAVFKHLIAPLYEAGVDFFWLDGQNGSTPGMNNQLWTNHLFFTDMQRRCPDRRPLILSRYGGIGGHRYPVGFSGDTVSNWETLACQVEMTARAGNVGQAYWSHDIGGHMHFFRLAPVGMPMDPELYVRWVQFGALSPVMRIHSTYGCQREFWAYGPRITAIMREALRLRMSLLPYLYHLTHVAYESGLPLCRPLYLHYPGDGAAYDNLDEYLLGDRLLVAPITSPGGFRHVYLPEGCWWSWLPGGAHAGQEGPLLQGPAKLAVLAGLGEIPVYARAGTLLPRQPVARRAGTGAPERLIIEVYPNAPGESAGDTLALYEDDGESLAYQRGEFSRLPISLRASDEAISVAVEPLEGEYPGMPRQRHFELRYRFVREPQAVELNGERQPAGQWEWDPAERALTVDVGRRSVEARWEVTVRF